MAVHLIPLGPVHVASSPVDTDQRSGAMWDKETKAQGSYFHLALGPALSAP